MAGGEPVPLPRVLGAAGRRVAQVRTPAAGAAGYGVEAPEFNWNDFKDVDVKGKTILVLVNDPAVPDPSNPGEFVVAEGNRRLVALRLLSRPGLAEELGLDEAGEWVALAADASLPDRFPVVVAEVELVDRVLGEDGDRLFVLVWVETLFALENISNVAAPADSAAGAPRNWASTLRVAP